MRLTFDLRHADHGPTIIVAAATTQSTRAQSALQRLERRQEDAHERGERRRLDAGGHEAGDDRRRAFVGVGRPHVERHGRHLEREADEQQADGDAAAAASAAIACAAIRLPMRSSRVLPVSAVGERDAVEEERARERAEQEVLERRLGGRRRVAADAGEHVDRERQHLEREEDDEQVRRRRHQHHAGDGEQHQRVVLAAAAGRSRSIVGPEKASDSSPTDDQDPGDEQPEVVGRRRRRSSSRCGSTAATERDGRADETDDAERADRHPLARRAERLGHHRGDAPRRSRRPSARWRSGSSASVGFAMATGDPRASDGSTGPAAGVRLAIGRRG